MSTPAATAAGKRRTAARSPRSGTSRPRKARSEASRAPSRRKRVAGARVTRRVLPSWRRWLVAAAVVAGALAIAYFAWFRHSSLVAVNDVKVEGVRSSDRDRITAALTQAAEGMTTLDVDASKLASAVNGFPAVASVTADPSFPHGLTVHVTERQPVAVASDGDREVSIAADGSLLPGLSADGTNLPALGVDQLPQAGQLDGEALDATRLLAAAPDPLRSAVETVTTTDDYGIVAALRGGIDLRFGTVSQARAKWAAAAAVLADPKVTTLEYVDLQVPSRPAIGG